ncbi:MAG: response regulator transcription factor [Chloroflexi bacterium]|nr:response regulator transcription factor [Chloroflexota bacterium]
MTEINKSPEGAQATILLVDDDQTLLETLGYNLRREGYKVLDASDGNKAISLAFAERPDLIILDVMLPGMSGLDVCRAVRKQLTVPILMLSAREEEIDKVLGLELGADDYMTKPFGLRELLARVRAMLRRAEIVQPRMEHHSAAEANQAGEPTQLANHAQSWHEQQEPGPLVIGGLSIDPARRAVTVSSQTIELKPKEFDLLTFMAQHPGHVFSRETLLERVWGYDFAGSTRTVDVHVRWLRLKLEQDPANPVIIQTVHSIGYKLQPPPSVQA